MGREVRRVPPNWEHPRWTAEETTDSKKIGKYKSMHDEDYETARQTWLSELEQWHHGSHHHQLYLKNTYGEDSEDFQGTINGEYDYWEYNSPPDRDSCRPKFTEEPTWYQLYQTVSEGTPVSPAFETQEELARYLSENGDFWYQNDQKEGRSSFRSKPTFEQAIAMVDSEWSPSLVTTSTGQVLDSYQAAEFSKNSKEGE